MRFHCLQRSLLIAVGVTLTTLATQANADFLHSNIITAGSDMTFAPYEYIDAGKPAGFDIKMLDGIAKSLNMKAVNIDTRFPNLITGLQGKRFDITNSSMYITPERLKVIDMIPYLKTGEKILALSNSHYLPQSPDQMCGHTIGAMSGTSFLQGLMTFSKNSCVAKGQAPITLREYPTDPQVTQALLSKAVEAQITDNAVAQSAIARLNGRVKMTSDKLLYPVLVGFGVRKDDPHIKQTLEMGLKKFSQTAEYHQLFEEYHFTPASEKDLQVSQAQ
ncbi:transporter substrate-binding domain-containing protein [Rosenbergiella australiborealis]|uniref:transporter substrate-binding domain-containing protein n=1 Tax=Rosenbergiella australiborealis TaxID=1544696 RepID=UPI003B8A6608